MILDRNGNEVKEGDIIHLYYPGRDYLTVHNVKKVRGCLVIYKLNDMRNLEHLTNLIEVIK